MCLDGEVERLEGVFGGFDMVVDGGAGVVICVLAAVVFCCVLS